MSSYVSAELRKRVAERAHHLCEYCLISEADTYFGCEVDHIISEKHGGLTEFENLAYACWFCNRYKGSDIGSIDWEESVLCRFYNPRSDRWSDHFFLDGMAIQPLTSIGRVTERIFRFNTQERLLERKALNEVGRYPGESAQAIIRSQ